MHHTCDRRTFFQNYVHEVVIGRNIYENFWSLRTFFFFLLYKPKTNTIPPLAYRATEVSSIVHLNTMNSDKKLFTAVGILLSLWLISLITHSVHKHISNQYSTTHFWQYQKHIFENTDVFVNIDRLLAQSRESQRLVRCKQGEYQGLGL